MRHLRGTARNRGWLITALALAVMAGTAGSAAAQPPGIMFITGGNVGIGTSTPTAKLHIVDTTNSGVLVADSGSNNNFIKLTSASFGTGFSFTAAGGRNWLMLASTADRLSFREDGTSAKEWFTVKTGGNVGFGVTNPTTPIASSTGASLTAGGVWQDASSRAFKQDIADLPLDAAAAALSELKPVRFAYKLDPDELQVGFIAEDVPELVASADRKGLSGLEIVAVVTKVVQDQQQVIRSLSQRVEKLERELAAARR